MASVVIRKLNAAFGTEVLSLSEADLSDAWLQQALVAAWKDTGLLVFRDVFGPDLQIKISQIFGDLERHPLAGSRAVDHPELMDVRYNSGYGDLYELDGSPLGLYLPWHFDLVYTPRINHGGVLRPVELPNSGGETGFLDQIKLYETLPEELKREIEPLWVIYKADFYIENAKFVRLPPALKRVRYGEVTIKAQEQVANAGRVLHPMVYTQPDTGRKVLNVSPWFAVGIESRETAEGDRLLQRVMDHCVSGETYFHRWRMGDMVLFDNWRMLHCMTGIPGGQSRWMQRTTIYGDYAFGREELRAAHSHA